MKFFLKNKKYSFMIILFIVSFFFIDNVFAIDIKNTAYINAINDNRFTGTYVAGTETWKDLNFSSTIDISGYNTDYVFFRLRELNFVDSSASLVDSDITTRCTYWAKDGNSTNYRCTQTAADTQQNFSYDPIDTSVTVFMQDEAGHGMTCFFTSELKDHIMCPLNIPSSVDKTKIKRLIFIFNTLSPTSSNSVSYAFRIDKQIYFGNNGSTDIINALSQIGQLQVNTTTTIENFNNYVSNNSTTQAQSNSTTALGGLSTTFNSHLSSMNELTQLVFLPINFIITVANNQCQPLVWNIPFVNTQVVVPCMSTIYNGYFSTFIAVFSTIAIGLLTYRCLLKFFNTVKGILDAEDDKIEVIDL